MLKYISIFIMGSLVYTLIRNVLAARKKNKLEQERFHQSVLDELNRRYEIVNKEKEKERIENLH